MRRRPRFDLLRVVLSCVGSFAEIEVAAHAIARVTSCLCADADHGPLLELAFPAGDDSDQLTPAQVSFLGALVADAAIWQMETYPTSRRWFTQARLPYDRESCARAVERGRR